MAALISFRYLCRMSIYDLNLRHLRAAVAVADEGTLSGAARRINISQPAISQSLARLEEQLGEALFLRDSGGATATEAGALLVARSRTAFGHLKHGFGRVRSPQASDGFSRADRMVTMPQLRALVSLADHGSYASASEATGLAQPSLHRAIRELETITGRTMTERRGRGVAITDAGPALVRAFRLARAELETGLDELASFAGQQVGRISVGAMPLSRASIVPKAFAAIHKRHPGLALDIVEGPYAELIEKLRDGDVDFLIGAQRTPGPGPDVEQLPLFDDHVAIIGAIDHPLARDYKDRFIPLAELVRYPWVVARHGAPLRELWQHLLGNAVDDLPAKPITCGSTMATRALLMEGPYLTLLSKDQLALELESETLVAIGRDVREGQRSIVLTQRTDWRRRPIHDELIAEIEKAVKP
jgi:DNA-binding transcriptional LysR family regulator